MSLKHQDAGKSAHPINVGEARWSNGCRGHGSPREFGIGSIRQRSVGRGNPAERAVRLSSVRSQRAKLGQRRPVQPHTTKLLMYGDAGPNRFAVYLWIAYQHGRAHAVVCCCQ